MATFQELQTALGDGEMIDLVESAIIKKAAAILEEASPSADRIAFAESALKNPEAYSTTLWRFIVGKNADQEIGQILRSQSPGTNPTDATIETQVTTAINALWP